MNNIKELPLWKRNILDLKSPNDTSNIRKTVQSIFQEFEINGIQSLVLDDIIGKKINIDHLIVVLNTTHVWEYHIPRWHDVVLYAKKVADSKQIHSEILLKLLD